MMNSPLRIIAIVFGRAGSQGLPNKNVMSILGRPCVTYAVQAAKASGIVQKIYISTDSKEIQQVCQPYGVEHITRPSELANHSALLEDAISHAFNEVESRETMPVDFYLILLANAPTVIPKRLQKARDILVSEPQLDCVTTGAKLNMYTAVRAWKMDSKTKRIKNYIPLEILNREVDVSCDRNKSEDCYFCDHSFTLVRRDALANLPDNVEPFRWMGNTRHLLEQPAGACDIDIKWQVPLVEQWLRDHGFSEEKL